MAMPPNHATVSSSTPLLPEKSWQTYLTLDLLVHVLSRSVFHPFIAWLVPLSLRSLSLPYSHPHFIGACVYASLVTLFAILQILDKRLAWGPPREVDWENEVVVITGGAGGLGRVLVDIFATRGVSVAVLDVRERKSVEESEGLQNVRFYRCDVGDAEAVEKVKPLIEKDLGAPTILINNAGVVNGAPLLSLSNAQLTRNFNINLLSHFYILRTFLPSLLSSPQGGTIVTIASVLGKLGTANLSDYTAAKAGQIAMHASLRAELASFSATADSANLRTILVTPGQLSTPLFAGVQTPNSFFGPVVEPVELAREIVEMVGRGESGEVSLPFYAKWIGVLGVLPASLQRLARWASGADGAMEGFGKAKASDTASKAKSSS